LENTCGFNWRKLTLFRFCISFAGKSDLKVEAFEHRGIFVFSFIPVPSEISLD
jgi:hypothetical protein